MLQCSFEKLGLGVVLALGVAAAVVFAGQSEQPMQVDDAAAYRGESTFRTYCASCHGKSATGDGPLAKDLKIKPANLTELSKRNGGEFPFEMVVSTIEHGRSVRGHGSEDMPAWADAFEMTSQSKADVKNKMNELAHYLWSLQVKD